MDLCGKNLKHYKKSMIDEYESHSSLDNANHNASSSSLCSEVVRRSRHLVSEDTMDEETESVLAKKRRNSRGGRSRFDDSDEEMEEDEQDGDYDEAAKKSKKLYCVCKTANTQRFMIACDHCDEWFHGDCVGVGEEFSNKIKTFYCHICRFKNPKLSIKYKKKFTEAEIREKFWKEINQREIKEHELLKKYKDKPSNKRRKDSKESHPSTVETLETKIDVTKMSSSSGAQFGKSQVSSEDIENFVSAIAQFGSEMLMNKPSEVKSEPVACSNELSMPSVALQNENSTQMSSDLNNDEPLNGKSSIIRNIKSNTKKPRAIKRSKKPNESGSARSNKRGSKMANIDDDDELYDSNEMSNDASDRHHYHHHHHQHRPSRKRATALRDEISESRCDEPSEKRQCLGPECTKVALITSKYCSDDCGMNLARKRIMYFLQENPSLNIAPKPGVATEMNEKQLERLNNDIDGLKRKLDELEEKHQKLDRLIERAKSEKIDDNFESEREFEDTEIFCVTCGHLISQRHVLKHMERCFNKYESQAFFGSYFKSHPEGQTVFCDFFNSQTKMYCKRLKVMCPEHEKEKKINDDEVCGCPMSKKNDIFDDSDEICLASKKNCQYHFKWDKLRRAQIDLEKLRLWVKLDEIYEQKRMLESAIANRDGFIARLLHTTIAHEEKSETN